MITSGIMAWLSVTFCVMKQATLIRGRGILVTRTHVRHYVASDEGRLEIFAMSFTKNYIHLTNKQASTRLLLHTSSKVNGETYSLLRPAPTDPSTVYSEITLRKETSKAHYDKQAQPPLMPLPLGSHAYAAISTGEPLDLWSRCFQSVATVLQHRHWQPHPPSKLSSVTTSWTPTKYPSALSTTALYTVFPTSNTKQFK